jgi:hypothetical protein
MSGRTRGSTKEFTGVAEAKACDASDATTARNEIEKKAALLSQLAGKPVGECEEAAGGFVRRFVGCDIYYSDEAGAHEVHGDIRNKYDALGGPSGSLGFPRTDELAMTDGVGRFNDFAGGSIYWTRHTGPMTMLKEVRDFWLSSGGQWNFGYPVIDQHRIPPISVDRDPHIQWCAFENGTIAQNAQTVMRAPEATLAAADLRKIVRTIFDSEVQRPGGGEIRLHREVETVSVTGWGHGFWASVPRTITFRLHGYHSHDALSHVDFRIDAGLRFELVWLPTVTEPTIKTLVATLERLRIVHDDGRDQLIPVVPGQVLTGVAGVIYRAFYPEVPDPTRPQVPAGTLFIASIPTGADYSNRTIDILGVITTPEGDLTLLVNPLPLENQPAMTGLSRKHAAQSLLESFVPL